MHIAKVHIRLQARNTKYKILVHVRWGNKHSAHQQCLKVCSWIDLQKKRNESGHTSTPPALSFFYKFTTVVYFKSTQQEELEDYKKQGDWVRENSVSPSATLHTSPSNLSMTHKECAPTYARCGYKHEHITSIQTGYIQLQMRGSARWYGSAKVEKSSTCIAYWLNRYEQAERDSQWHARRHVCTLECQLLQ